MHTFQIVIFVLLAALAWQPAANAVTICSSPMRPACINLDFTYGDQASENRCTQDLEHFEEDVEDYAQCLERLIRETREDVKAAHDAFEEKAQEE